jgi:hypothetical protein
MNKILPIGAVILIVAGAAWYFATPNTIAPVENTTPVTSNTAINTATQTPTRNTEVNTVTTASTAPNTKHPLNPGAGEQGFAKLGANAIYVAEQRPGNTIVINNVNIVPKGYVVIHESKDSVPGKIIGYTALDAGTQTTKLKVTLDRDVTDGEELIAMLHADNGDGKFDAATDSPVQDSMGNPLFMVFSVFKDAQDPSSVQVMF